MKGKWRKRTCGHPAHAAVEAAERSLEYERAAGMPVMSNRWAVVTTDLWSAQKALKRHMRRCHS